MKRNSPTPLKILIAVSAAGIVGLCTVLILRFALGDSQSTEQQPASHQVTTSSPEQAAAARELGEKAESTGDTKAAIEHYETARKAYVELSDEAAIAELDISIGGLKALPPSPTAPTEAPIQQPGA